MASKYCMGRHDFEPLTCSHRIYVLSCGAVITLANRFEPSFSLFLAHQMLPQNGKLRESVSLMYLPSFSTWKHDRMRFKLLEECPSNGANQPRKKFR
jgi:hypothetical protein